MSETVIRHYREPVPLSGHRRKRSGRGKRAGPVLFVLFVLAAVYVAWATRDTYPVEEFIPADHKFSIVLTKAMDRRAALAQSRVWDALPAEAGLAAVPEVLGRDFGMPAWVVNNLVPEQCYLTGNDLERFHDIIVLSKMTRVGRLIERVAHWGPWTEQEYAGGLRLRRWIRDELYYAARGRVLIASPSREALIRALTLGQEDSVGAEALAEWTASSDMDDIHGSVILTPEDPLGNVFRAARFALRIDVQQAQLKCQATLTPEWEARLSPLLYGVSPQPLAAPIEGMVGLSANFGKSVEDVCHGLARAFPSPTLSEAVWPEWEQTSNGALSRLVYVLDTLIGPSGPGFRLSWRGMDMNEIIPVPEIVGVFETADPDIDSLFETFQPLPEGVAPWAPVPRYNPETKLVSLPLFSGPSYEPAIARVTDMLLLSNSRTLVENLRAGPAMGVESLPQPGNLFIRMRPRPCVKTVVEVGRMLAEVGLLRGHDRESFEATASDWLDKARRIKELSLFATYERPVLVAEVTLLCGEDG